jgi:predicted nucleotidyltransferase
MLRELISRDPEGFKRLCEEHQVSTLHAFGSSVHGPFRSDSDVDLVVDLKARDPLAFGELMLDLWDKLEAFFGRRVDLLTMRSVKNPVMREVIERTKVLVYDGDQAQVLVVCR